MTRIRKIPLEFAKESWRYEGIGLTKAEYASISKINEIVDYINKNQ